MRALANKRHGKTSSVTGVESSMGYDVNGIDLNVTRIQVKMYAYEYEGYKESLQVSLTVASAIYAENDRQVSPSSNARPQRSGMC